MILYSCCFFFSSRRRHTRFDCDWSSDVCSSDLLRDGRITNEGVVVIKAQQHRTQEQNLRAALQRLNVLVAAAYPEPILRRATRPTLGSQRRRLESRSEEHTSELQSQSNLVCRLLLEKKKKKIQTYYNGTDEPSHNEAWTE